MKNTNVNRNPVTGRFESNAHKCDCTSNNECKCNPTAQTAFTETNPKSTSNYGFYSKVLQKPFDTLVELAEAEAKFFEAENAKRKASEAKKADANRVEDAFKKLNAAKRAYNEDVLTAKKTYLAEVGAAKEKLNARLVACEDALFDANKKYDEALKEFTKAHPEGYHVTLRDDDNVVTISSKSDSTEGADTTADFLNLILQMIK